MRHSLRRRLATLGLLCLCVVGLTACEPAPADEEPRPLVVEVEAAPGTLRLFAVPTAEGHHIPCVVFEASTAEGGGVSCSFSHLTTPPTP